MVDGDDYFNLRKKENGFDVRFKEFFLSHMVP